MHNAFALCSWETNKDLILWNKVCTDYTYDMELNKGVNLHTHIRNAGGWSKKTYQKGREKRKKNSICGSQDDTGKQVHSKNKIKPMCNAKNLHKLVQLY